MPITFIFTGFQIGLINKYKIMNNNLKLVVNNVNEKKFEDKHFFEKDELKIILDLYAKMVSEGSWKDYGLKYIK